jgi:casein kinase 1
LSLRKLKEEKTAEQQSVLMIADPMIEVLVSDVDSMCPHVDHSQKQASPSNGGEEECLAPMARLRADSESKSHKSHRSRCSSEYSCHSVDLEKGEQKGGIYFGSDLRFEEEKHRLYHRVMAADEDLWVGDEDSKTQLLDRISGGSFGEVYLGRMKNLEEDVAVKLEPRNLQTQYLLHEGSVYRKLENGPGIPRVHWYGMHGSDYSVMIMDLLGPTIQHLFANCNHQLSLKTVLQLADQMLRIMEHVHRNNFVHRDISPSNFTLGLGKHHNQVFLIDFGHARKLATGFIPGRRTSTKRPMVGTPRFASIFTHMGREEARRDDLESLGFIWVYLLKGRLPWQGIQCNSHQEKLAEIAKRKMNTPLDVLCEGIPREFAEYIHFVRHLKQQDVPDYNQIREFFRELAAKEGIVYDNVYDWDHPKSSHTD